MSVLVATVADVVAIAVVCFKSAESNTLMVKGSLGQVHSEYLIEINLNP